MTIEKTFTIKITGQRLSDIEDALSEVKRLIESDMSSGMNSNDSGSFTFKSEGEFEDEVQL